MELLNSLKNALDDKMHSAYTTDVMYSNYTQAFSGLLDYIYFTNQHLELIQVNILLYAKYFTRLHLPCIFRYYLCHRMMILF